MLRFALGAAVLAHATAVSIGEGLSPSVSRSLVAAAEHEAAYQSALYSVTGKIDEAVSANPSNVSAVACTAPRRRGHVKKAAHGQQNPVLGQAPANEAASVYLHQRIPVYSHCHVLISHKWKFIYIRQMKAASKSMLDAFVETFCPPSKHEHAYLSVCDGDVRTEPLSSITQSMWEEYFVFTIVRNPWLRQLSALGYLQRDFLRTMVDGQSEPGEPCGVTVEQMAQHSYVLREICRTKRCCAYVPRARRFSANYPNIFINGQSQCVFMPNGQSLVDYIGSAETLQEDWDVIVGEISKRTGVALQSPQVFNFEGRVKNGCTQAKVVHALTPEVVRGLGRQYAMDIEYFGYL